MNCPYCGGIVSSGESVCPDCHEDLAALAHLEQQHVLLYNEGLAFAKAGHYDEARDKLLAAIARSPDYVPAQRLLAKVYVALKDWHSAQSAALRAAELAPEDLPTRKLLDDIHVRSQKMEVSHHDDALSRRQAAEGILDSYQHDVMGAFAIGAGLATVGALFMALIGKGKRKS